MSYVTGTASGFMDLLDELDAFLCDAGHAWGKTYSGTGDGTLTAYAGKAASVAETFTIEATSSTSFDVTGTVSGSIGPATVGTPFTSSVIDFTLTAGGVAFVAGDTFTLNTTPKWDRLRYDGCIGASYRTGTNWTSGSTNDYTKAFDDTNAHARSLGVTAYLNVEMYRAVAVTNFNLSCGDSTTITPKDISLDYSDDGSSWTTHQSWTSLTWATVQERKAFTVTGSPGAHKHWRVAFTAAQSGQTTVRVTELEFFSDPAFEWQLEDRFAFGWMAPGLDGTKEIFVGGYTYQDQPAGIHNLVFVGCRFWNPNKRITDQQNNSGTKTLVLNNQPTTYHFIANGQRVIVIAIPSGSYQTGYFGFGLPYETPTIHPFPLIIGASADEQAMTLSTTTTEQRACWNPGQTALAAYYPDNNWRRHANRSGTTSSDGTSDSVNGKTFPWAFTSAGVLLSYIRDQIDGGFPLTPGVLSYNVGGVSHVFGEFDGIYHVTGFNNSAGTTISLDGFSHLVVQNIARTGVQDYAAIRLD